MFLFQGYLALSWVSLHGSLGFLIYYQESYGFQTCFHSVITPLQYLATCQYDKQSIVMMIASDFQKTSYLLTCILKGNIKQS
jgi:hypothetical protein